MLKVVNFLFIFLLLQSFAGAQVVEIPEDLSQLSSSITDFEIRKGEGLSGPTAFGRIDDSEVKRLGYVQMYPPFGDPSVLSIEFIYVDEYAQSRGVAYTLLKYAAAFQEKFTETPVKKIEASSYVGGNLDPFLTVLISRLRKKPGYIKPDKTKSKSEQFRDCCSKIYNQHQDVVYKATNFIPTVKVGKKLGFKVCKDTLEFKVPEGGKKDIHLNFDMCKTNL